MKILIVNENFKRQGGTETICLSMYELLKRNGHEAYFFATKTDDLYDKTYKFIKYFPENVYSTIGYLKKPLKYFYNYEAAKNLKLMINEVNPDVIHFNHLISPSVLLACKNINIPVVLTFHSVWCICPASSFMYKNKEICNNFYCKNGNYWHCISNKCKNNSIEASIRKAILNYIYIKTNAYSCVSKFIVPSNAIKNLIIQTDIGIDKNKLVVIKNSYSNEQKTKEPTYTNKGYFLYVGRIEKEKGIPLLLKAFEQLPSNVELHIVGKGSYENKLKKYIKKHNKNNILFKGFMCGEELKAEYQNCISIIVPSECFDNFPTTNLEAFSNGKPSISSNVGGIPEQIEHNKNGLLFDCGNVEQLKNSILFYYNNPNIVIEHGKNAYNKAINDYTEEVYYNKLLKIYKGLRGE